MSLWLHTFFLCVGLVHYDHIIGMSKLSHNLHFPTLLMYDKLHEPHQFLM